MNRTIVLGTLAATSLVLALPFVGGAGPSILISAHAGGGATEPAAEVTIVGSSTADAEKSAVALVASPTSATPAPTVPPGPSAAVTRDQVAVTPTPTAAQPAAATQPPACPGNVAGHTGSAPSTVSAGGVAGTTSADLATFATAFNSIRVANCLQPVPLANFRYDACMEQRLFWIAEDPSTDPTSAWGHIGSVRSDGLPSVGCDGNLAGGMNNTAATAAQKWWNSPDHRISLYKPDQTGSTANACIYFAMTHGGVPDEPAAFTRAAARNGGC